MAGQVPTVQSTTTGGGGGAGLAFGGESSCETSEGWGGIQGQEETGDSGQGREWGEVHTKIWRNAQ